MNKSSKIYVAGHKGLVGSAILRKLEKEGFYNIIKKTHGDLDLKNQDMVNDFFKQTMPDVVILAAAKVGGIYANNKYPAEFIYDNLMIEANVIHAAYQSNVERLLFLGSSCIYPKSTSQPIQENALLTGLLEKTNEPYAIAKIAGIKLCESYNRQYGTDYRSVMPTNLYGPGDSFHPFNSHVIPALLQRFHKAKLQNSSEVIVWGSGMQRREFLYVDDMAEASIFILKQNKDIYNKITQPMLSHVNIGSGVDYSIREVAETIKKIVGYQGELVFDTTKPDGTMRKMMDSKILHSLGWRHKINLSEGLSSTYKWMISSNSLQISNNMD
jgi:GDP-L-fucose synthase